MEQGLIAAFGALTAAITGVGGILWRMHRTGNGNGHAQADIVYILKAIQHQLEDADKARHALGTQMAASYREIAESLTILKDRTR